MRYEGRVYRPPSESDALLLQATIGCSWNHCTYCDMYRDKHYRVRELHECIEDLATAERLAGDRVDKLFVMDGDALGMPTSHWEAILALARRSFPHLRRVSCYATARNLLQHSPQSLLSLRQAGLSRLYIGPESGDDVTLQKIAKGATFEEHAKAAQLAREAGMELSVITLLGAGGVARSAEHAEATGRLITAMDPAFASALTLTIVEGTPLATLASRGGFVLPSIVQLLGELRTIVSVAEPTAAVFRTNHASNYLPLGGRLPHDRARIVSVIDAALTGRIPLRAEHSRGL